MENVAIRSEIGFGEVRHARLRPASHRFAYPAYFLRLPLRSIARLPWPFKWLSRNSRGIFALNDADHGDGSPMLQWIDALLKREGVDDADGEIWLHTFPRVFGYVFNPVSFWMIERADGDLRAVLCEVNNTFGERHFYLLAHPDGSPLRYGEELSAAKVFHVSPFCPVQGGYRFRFMLSKGDALHPPRFVGRINYDDLDGPLLETSLSGALEPLTDRAMLRALFAYPVFTFGVIARIHWHALRLWIKRVPFFSKPAPPNLDVTR